MDVSKIMCPKDTRNLARLDRMQAIYAVLEKIGAQYKPETIFEIGVRAGYSAYALITGSGRVKHYTGIDCDDQKRYGGPWLYWAEKLLYGLSIPYRIRRDDSQTLDILDAEYDLIHVDGDHTYEGAMHDMALCWPHVVAGGVMVVDDATYLPGPRRAVADFQATIDDAKRVYLEPSPTGSMVFVKGGA